MGHFANLLFFVCSFRHPTDTDRGKVMERRKNSSRQRSRSDRWTGEDSLQDEEACPRRYRQIPDQAIQRPGRRQQGCQHHHAERAFGASECWGGWSVPDIMSCHLESTTRWRWLSTHQICHWKTGQYFSRNYEPMLRFYSWLLSCKRFYYP